MGTHVLNSVDFFCLPEVSAFLLDQLCLLVASHAALERSPSLLLDPPGGTQGTHLGF